MTHINLDALDARTLLLPEFEEVEIVLVGCGGTGSWLAPHIIRIGRLYRDLQGTNLRITFVDKDKVEEKNTYRQNFVPAEIGHFKAEALAVRYGLSSGCEIRAMNKNFSAHEVQPKEYPDDPLLGIFIGCVDNPAARRELEETILRLRYRRFNILIDCGNHKRSGQVIVGTTVMPKVKPFVNFPGYCTWLPRPSAWHEELTSLANAEKQRKEKPAGDKMSCAEIAMTDQQGLSINAVMASIAADYLAAILLSHNLNRFATYIDLDGTMQHRYITPRIIKPGVLNASPKNCHETYGT